MKLLGVLLSFHSAVKRAGLRDGDYAKFQQMIGMLTERPQLLPSYEETKTAILLLRSLPEASNPRQAFGLELEARLARYSFFCREVQEGLSAVNSVATLAAAADLFGINGSHTTPWNEAKTTLEQASLTLDAYMDGDRKVLSSMASVLDKVFELGLACTEAPNTNFKVSEETISDLLKRRDELFVNVMLEQL